MTSEGEQNHWVMHLFIAIREISPMVLRSYNFFSQIKYSRLAVFTMDYFLNMGQKHAHQVTPNAELKCLKGA